MKLDKKAVAVFILCRSPNIIVTINVFKSVKHGGGGLWHRHVCAAVSGTGSVFTEDVVADRSYRVNS